MARSTRANSSWILIWELRYVKSFELWHCLRVWLSVNILKQFQVKSLWAGCGEDEHAKHRHRRSGKGGSRFHETHNKASWHNCFYWDVIQIVRHLNIVNLMGVCLPTEADMHPMLLLELCEVIPSNWELSNKLWIFLIVRETWRSCFRRTGTTFCPQIQNIWR